MGKNKWLERARVYDALEEKGYGHLTKKIEDGISRLKAWINSGEDYGADAYRAIVQNASPENMEKAIDLLNEYIETCTKNGPSLKWHVGLYSGVYANSVMKALSFPEKASKRALDRCSTAYKSNFCNTGSEEVSMVSEVLEKVPEKYQESLIDDVFDYFLPEPPLHKDTRSRNISKSYGSIFSLPSETQETAMEHYIQFRKNDENVFEKSTKLMESYVLLHKAFGEKLPEKMAMVKKLADVLGYDVAIQRANQMAAEEVEKSVK